MGRDARAGVLLLSVLLVVTGGYAVRARDEARPPEVTVTTPASVTRPEAAADPVVVRAAASPNNRGWQSAGQGATGAAGVRADLMDAYGVAVGLAPSGCHLSVSLLAAIGQVESGNLAGRSVTARHRVAPAVLGPVLDGDDYAAIKDTDDGELDGHRRWDRALGPLQFLPATWRVVGLDMDADGVRDPQNIYDAAGAAMVYLCDGGRDLGTREGLEEAVLAYNHSRAYLREVLAWKTVFDAADLLGVESEPAFGAWAVPTESFGAAGTAAASGSGSGVTDGGAVAAGKPGGVASKTGPRTTQAGSRPAGDGARPSPSAAAATGSTGTDPGKGRNPGQNTSPGTNTEPAKKPDPTKGPGNDDGGKGDGGGQEPDPGTAGPDPTETPLPTCTVDEAAPTADPTLDPNALETPTCCLLPDGTTVVLPVTPTDAPSPVNEAAPLPEACVVLTALPSDFPTGAPTE